MGCAHNVLGSFRLMELEEIATEEQQRMMERFRSVGGHSDEELTAMCAALYEFQGLFFNTLRNEVLSRATVESTYAGDLS